MDAGENQLGKGDSQGLYASSFFLFSLNTCEYLHKIGCLISFAYRFSNDKNSSMDYRSFGIVSFRYRSFLR